MTKKTVAAAPSTTATGVPFGVNEVRLSGPQWLGVGVIVLSIVLLVPRLWEKIEGWETGPDYRIPYALSKDYWLYGRRIRQVVNPDRILVLGDSVIWGEYVLPDGTLSHFLDRQAGVTNRFINAGVNGLFPLALEGLVRYYAPALRRQKVLLHCNPLWMTSPKADLSTDKEDSFNHADLVPQYFPRIPCYKADANERLSAIVAREIDFVAWIHHLQNACFSQKSLLKWTLEDDGQEPPHFTNAWKNPFAQISLKVPAAVSPDPQRGPGTSRHKSWSENGQGSTRFDWVELDRSLQWQAFQRLIKLLQQRENHVFVMLGPFNEHMIAEENRPAFRKLREGMTAWLSQNQVPYAAPAALPSALYADASHPLTSGYESLAKQLYQDAEFQRWLKR